MANSGRQLSASRLNAHSGNGTAIRVNGFDGSPPALVPLTAGAWRDQLCSVVHRPFTTAELLELTWSDS